MNLRTFFKGRAVGFTIILVVVLLVAAFYAFNSYIYDQKQGYAARDYKDAEYIIEGVRVRLTGTTAYFGNEVTTDLDGDGREDVVFLITQNPGGSGTFYYVVAALNTPRGYVGSEALLLGDRIAPQTTGKGKGKIVIVNYADRASGEPFTTSPSVGKSLWLILDPQTLQFGQVEQNFEGEADPSKMTLGMQTWTWISAEYGDGRLVTPRSAKAFTLRFSPEGRFSATTDCNSAAGNYVAGSSTIAFSQLSSTKMYCEGSQEMDFAEILQETSGYHFTSRGELILDLKFDSGSAVFR